METILIFLTVLAAVTCRSVPNTNYIPTKEQLELIFGPKATTEGDTPALVANESVIKEKKIKPYQRDISNAIREYESNTVQLNIKINVDCDKKGGDKKVKQNPGKGDPDTSTRIVEDVSNAADRVALEGKECPKGFGRFGNLCVEKDK